MKKILEYIGGLIAIAVIFGGPYYYSWITGGSLTTAESKSGHCTKSVELFLSTGIDAKRLRSECPSITRERILRDYEAYFSLPENQDSVWKDNLKQDIENNF